MLPRYAQPKGSFYCGDGWGVFRLYDLARRITQSDHALLGHGVLLVGVVVAAAIDKPKRGPGPAGAVTYALAATTSETLTLFTSHSGLHRVAVSEVADGSRVAVSKPLLTLVLDERVCGRLC
jgi:hypothetical protein